MDNKKTQQIGIVLPILLAISFVMLLLYLMFGIFDRQLNETYYDEYNDNNYNNAQAGTSDSTVQGNQSNYTVRNSVTCYTQTVREQLAKYGEPRAVQIGNAPGKISSVYSPELYYLDGAYFELLDLDGDGIQELFCAAIDHDQMCVKAKLYGFTDGNVILLKDDLPVMLLPEDSEQTVFMHKTPGEGCYLVFETFNPDGKPVELMDFYEKSGTEFRLAGKYSSGNMKDTLAFDGYIRVASISSIPLSVKTDSLTGEIVTSGTFPQAGTSEDAILHAVQESTDVIGRILQLTE